MGCMRRSAKCLHWPMAPIGQGMRCRMRRLGVPFRRMIEDLFGRIEQMTQTESGKHSKRHILQDVYAHFLSDVCHRVGAPFWCLRLLDRKMCSVDTTTALDRWFA